MRLRDAKRLLTLVDRIETRCMATDGPVTATLDEATQEELVELMRVTRMRHRTDGGRFLTEEGLRMAYWEALAAVERARQR